MNWFQDSLGPECSALGSYPLGDSTVAYVVFRGMTFAAASNQGLPEARRKQLRRGKRRRILAMSIQEAIERLAIGKADPFDGMSQDSIDRFASGFECVAKLK